MEQFLKNLKRVKNGEHMQNFYETWLYWTRWELKENFNNAFPVFPFLTIPMKKQFKLLLGIRGQLATLCIDLKEDRRAARRRAAHQCLTLTSDS